MRSVNLSKAPSLSLVYRLSSTLALFVALSGCSSLPPDNLGADLGDVDLSTQVAQSCAACTSDQVCVDGACANVPKSCPCPKETYCDLATNQCKVGCTSDGECTTGRICNDARSCQAGCRKDETCGSGQICDSGTTTCRAGCRKDTECGSGKICVTPDYKCVAGCRKDMDCGSSMICDTTSKTCKQGCRSDTDCTILGTICNTTANMCQPGCRTTATCPNEQICDTTSSKCIAGCDTDMRCNAGHICDSVSLKCVDGCRTSASCPLNSYCDTTTTKKCKAGCNADKTRCAVGEACVGFTDGSYKCQAACAGYACNGTGWECYKQGSDYLNARCRMGCTNDANCGTGQRCTWFTTNAAVPGTYRKQYCSLPCATAGCSTCVDSYGMAGTGMCDTTKGCLNGGTYTCYQTVPSYGL